MDTLAVWLALPLAGCALDLNQQVSAPCRAHENKNGADFVRAVPQFLLPGDVYTS